MAKEVSTSAMPPARGALVPKLGERVGSPPNSKFHDSPPKDTLGLAGLDTWARLEVCVWGLLQPELARSFLVSGRGERGEQSTSLGVPQTLWLML